MRYAAFLFSLLCGFILAEENLTDQQTRKPTMREIQTGDIIMVSYKNEGKTVPGFKKVLRVEGDRLVFSKINSRKECPEHHTKDLSASSIHGGRLMDAEEAIKALDEMEDYRFVKWVPRPSKLYDDIDKKHFQ